MAVAIPESPASWVLRIPVDWLHTEGEFLSSRSFSSVWAVALATYGVGDVVTTSPSSTRPDVHRGESSDSVGDPVVRRRRLLGLTPRDTPSGLTIRGGVLEEDPLLYYGPPALLTVLGLAVTGFNLTLLFS